MAQIADNVVASKPQTAGCVYVAPAGTDLPTDGTTALNSAFKSLGYISEDGVSEEINAEKTDIKAFGGDTVLTVRTSHSLTYTFTPMEHKSVDVLKEIYGDDNVSVIAGKAVVKVNSKEQVVKVYVFEFVLSDGTIERVVVPRGKASASGKTTYADGSQVSNELTVDAFPDEDGNKAYKYLAVASE